MVVALLLVDVFVVVAVVLVVLKSQKYFSAHK
jgi:hypothetical protein